MAERKVLHSWKEIANYMGLGVRTVQRYEADSGLPIRRPSGTTRSSVLAFSDEIDRWLSAAPKHSAAVVKEAVPKHDKTQAPIDNARHPETRRRIHGLLERAKETTQRAGVVRDRAARHSDEVLKLMERARAIRLRYPFKHVQDSEPIQDKK